MELLIILVLLIVIAVVVLPIVGSLFGGGLFFWTERTRKKAEANAPAILDEAFDGREDVVFKINMETPSYETVILGAKHRGYVLSSETNDTASGVAKTLIFERREMV